MDLTTKDQLMDLTTKDQQDGWNALDRLLRVARKDTGQARRVASFLLAWHNAEENGGWDPTDLWNVDAAIADDMADRRASHPRVPPLSGMLWGSGTKSRPCGAHGEEARL